MNFKFFILFVLVAACGVKGDPVSPKDQNLPSLIENYPDIDLKVPLNEQRRR